MGWKLDEIRAEIEADVDMSKISKEDLGAICLDMMAAIYPFRIMLDALTVNPRLSRYSHRRAYSDLFPHRSLSDDHADDDVWAEIDGKREWMSELGALEKGYRYWRCDQGIELCEARLGPKFEVLNVSGSELSASVHQGSLCIEDFERLAELVAKLTTLAQRPRAKPSSPDADRP